MFRSKLIKSCVSAVRTCAKPAMSMRSFTIATTRATVCANTFNQSLAVRGMDRRFFSTQTLSGKDIRAKIEACGINDAGKEAVIGEEIKNKNFAGLRDAAEE